MKAISYIRVSGQGQCEGDGPDRQREKIKAFCQAHGIEYSAEAFERGVSGTVEALDRPAFVDALSLVHPANAILTNEYCLVVERLDRLARDLMVQELLLSECRKRGIKVYAADQGLIDVANDEGNPTQTLVRQIMGAIAQWEKSVIVMKLRGARERKKRETGRCEGPLPYGSLAGESTILAYARDLKRRGHPFSHIAGSLNLSGYKTRTGKPWNKARVAHLFQTRKNTCEEATQTTC